MVECSVLRSLPEPARRALLQAAFSAYLDYLVKAGLYEQAAELVKRYWRTVGIPGPEAERILNTLRAYRLLQEAYATVEIVAELAKQGRVTDSDLERIKELIGRLETVTGVPREVAERVLDAIAALKDVYALALASRIKPVVEELAERLSAVADEAGRILSALATAVTRGDIATFGFERGLLESLARRLDELARRAEEAWSKLTGVEGFCASDECRRRIRELAEAAERIKWYARGLARLARLASNFLFDALSVFTALKADLSRLAHGENPYDVLPALREDIRRLLELVKRADRLPAEAVEGLPAYAANEVRRAAEQLARGVKTAAMNLYHALVELCAHNDDLWNALVEATRAAGFAPPERPKVPPAEKIADLVAEWLAKLDYLARFFERLGYTTTIFQQAFGHLLTALALHTAKHMLALIASIPAFMVEAGRTTIESGLEALRGNIVGAAERVARFLWELVLGMVGPLLHPESPLDAAGYIIALTVTAKALEPLSRLRIPLPARVRELMAKSRLLSLFAPREISFETITDMLFPLFRILRVVGEHVAKEVAHLVEAARRVAGKEPVLAVAEIGRETGAELILTPEAEAMLRKIVEDVLSQRLDKRLAYALALDIVRALERLGERGGGIVYLSSLPQAKFFAAFVSWPRLLTESVRHLEKLIERMRAVEELRRVLIEYSKAVPKVDDVVRLAEEIAEHYASVARMLRRLELYGKELGAIDPLLQAEVLRFVRRVREAGVRVVEPLRRIYETVERLASSEKRLREELVKIAGRYGGLRYASLVARARTLKEALRYAIEAVLSSREYRKAVAELAKAVELMRRELEALLARLASDLHLTYRWQVRLADVKFTPPLTPDEWQLLKRAMERASVTELTLLNLPRVLQELIEMGKDVENLTLYVKLLRHLLEYVKSIEPLLEKLTPFDVDIARVIEAIHRFEPAIIGVMRNVESTVPALVKVLYDIAKILEAAGDKAGAEKVLSLARRLDNLAAQGFAILRTTLLDYIREVREVLEERAKMLTGRTVSEIISELERLRGTILWPAVEQLIETLARFKGYGGVVIRVKEYELRGLRALDPETAAKFARMLLARRYRYEVVVPFWGLAGVEVFHAERSVSVKPGRLELVYRVVGPGGFWAEYRVEFAVTDGKVRVSHVESFDPRVKGNKAAQAILSVALREAVERDPLIRELGDKIIVVTTPPRTLEDAVEEVFERRLKPLVEMGERLLASLSQLPPQAIELALLPPAKLPGGFERHIEVKPGVIVVRYERGGKVAEVILTPERIEVRGSLPLLLEALSVDVEVRERLRRFVKPPTPEEVEAVVRMLAKPGAPLPPTAASIVFRAWLHGGRLPGGEVTFKPGGTVSIRFKGAARELRLPPETRFTVIYTTVQPPPPPMAKAAAPTAPRAAAATVALAAAAAAGRPVREKLVF